MSMMQIFGVKFTFEEFLENLIEIATYYESTSMYKEIDTLVKLLNTYKQSSFSSKLLVLDVVYEIYKLYLMDCLKLDNPEEQYIYLQFRLYQIDEHVWIGFDLHDFIIDDSINNYEFIPFATLYKMKTYLQIISQKPCGIYNIPIKD